MNKLPRRGTPTLTLRVPHFAFELDRLARAPRTYLVRFFFVAVLVGLAILLWPFDAPGQQLFQASARVFEVFFKAEIILALVVVPVLVAPAIPAEREARTLELLVSCPEPEGRLLLGKLASVSLLVLLVLAAGFPVGIASTLLGGVPVDRALTACIHIAVCAAFSTCLALRCSLHFAGSTASTVAALGLQAAVIVGTFIASNIVAAAVEVGTGGWLCFACGITLVAIPIAWMATGRFPRKSALAAGVSLAVIGALGSLFGPSSAGGAAKYSTIVQLLCPWMAYWDDALSGTRVAPNVVLVAWCVHLTVCALLVAGPFQDKDAGRLLFGTTAEDRERKLHPKHFTEAWGEFLKRQKGVAARRPRWSRLSTHPRSDFLNHSRVNPFLPVGDRPIYWKETSWARFPALDRLRSGAFVVGWLMAVAAFFSLWSDSSPGWEPAILLGIVIVLVAAAGSATLAHERTEGTMPVLLSTGYSPMQIVLEKSRAALRWCMPAFVPAIFMMLISICRWGPLGVSVSFVFAGTVGSVLGVSVGCSAATRHPRLAFSLTAIFLIGLWWLPTLLGERWTDAAPLAGLNPFNTLESVQRLERMRTTEAAIDGLATFALASGFLTVVPIVIASMSLERQVRA